MIWGYAGIAALILCLIALFALLRNLKTRRVKDVMKLYAGRQIWAMEGGASFFGQQTRGRGQLRGNGVLVLGDDGIYYEMWAPRRKLHIPYHKVLTAEKIGIFLGKSCFKPLLKVVFINDQGKPDAAAWWVRDVDRYVTIVQNLRGRR